MLRAYLRGLLKPKLKNKTTSRIREEMLFYAMDMEDMASQAASDLQVLVAASAPHYNPQKVPEKIRSLQDSLARLHRYSGFDMSDPKKEKLSGFDDMVAMYNLLDKKGLLEKLGMDEKLKKMISAQQEEE
jgi:hypothetical protein